MVLFLFAFLMSSPMAQAQTDADKFVPDEGPNITETCDTKLTAANKEIGRLRKKLEQFNTELTRLKKIDSERRRHHNSDGETLPIKSRRTSMEFLKNFNRQGSNGPGRFKI